MSRFTVQSIVGEAHLGSDEEDFLVCEQDATVVAYILIPNVSKKQEYLWSPAYSMPHAHTHVDEHVFAYRIFQDLSDNLPAVKESIRLN
jgi:hypothetical protein